MARITVGTTPTRLDATDRGGSWLYRCPTADLYLGRTPAEATTAAGYLLPAGEPFSEDAPSGAKLYAVVATGTAAVHVLGSGVTA